MLLNQIAETLAPLDLTCSGEYASLVKSAAELGVPHEPTVRLLSGHTVVRWSRFHFLEWGEPSAPAVLLLHGMNQSAHSWDLVSRASPGVTTCSRSTSGGTATRSGAGIWTTPSSPAPPTRSRSWPTADSPPRSSSGTQWAGGLRCGWRWNDRRRSAASRSSTPVLS